MLKGGSELANEKTTRTTTLKTKTYSIKRPLQTVREPPTPQKEEIIIRNKTRHSSLIFNDYDCGSGSNDVHHNHHNRKSEIVRPPRRQSLLPPSVTQFKKLLSLCNSVDIPTFKEFIIENSFEAKKIGESSFCEAFKTNNNRVWKVMPLLQPKDCKYGDGDGRNVDEEVKITKSPEPVEVEHLIHEIECLIALKGLGHVRRFAIPPNHTGFNHLISCHVVSGPYPEELLMEWRAWEDAKGSQNTAPLHYQEDDLHVILQQEYGGIDLESFPITSPTLIRSILLQLLCALSLGEKEVEFEHRDLHPGNVLLEESNRSLIYLPDHSSLLCEGVICRIIDCSMSRILKNSSVCYRDLEGDQWLFEGSSSISAQYDVYREMSKMFGHVKDWSEHRPKTNLLWLEYLKQYMLGKLGFKRRNKFKNASDDDDDNANLLKSIRKFKFISFENVGDCYQKAKIAFNK